MIQTELLFRGKCVSLDFWLYGDSLGKEFSHHGIKVRRLNNKLVRAETLTQYTGIVVPSSGDKIFYGDVVRVAGYGSLLVEDIGDIGTLLDALPEGDVEDVVGNVFDNPNIEYLE